MFEGAPRRRPTSTSAFGVSRRESHDSSGFYARFTPPRLSSDATVSRRDRAIDEIFAHDAASMPELDDGSVALVVTSPPYFAGKEYEEALGQGHVPASYLDFLAMLEAVFAECVRKLEPGGRIAVNVANLGRRPYRSLSADVIHILQDALGLLLRGEIIWQKARGSSGSCAWGSYQRPANPVLRDLTERVIVASKGRFDRALTAAERARLKLPSDVSLKSDDFMELTTDVWEMPAESATRVGHPAPFPVELPERLIQLYTYYGDLVLDPFMGSGTTAVAAVRSDRHYAGYDTDVTYVEAARRRVEDERERLREGDRRKVHISARPTPADPDEGFQQRAVREGLAAKQIARDLLDQCQFSDIRTKVRCGGGVEVTFSARDSVGRLWLFDVSGAFTTARPGLKRTDTLWKALGKAAVLHAVDAEARLVLLTTDTPERGAGDAALRAVCGPGKPIRDVIRMLDEDDVKRLVDYQSGAT